MEVHSRQVISNRPGQAQTVCRCLEVLRDVTGSVSRQYLLTHGITSRHVTMVTQIYKYTPRSFQCRLDGYTQRSAVHQMLSQRRTDLS